MFSNHGHVAKTIKGMALAAGVAFGGVLGGCASRVPIRYARPGPVESANWAAVLPGEAIAGDDERGQYLAMTRRDDAMGIRRESTPALAGSWSQEDRPSLDHARRLFIPTTPGSIIYFGERRNSWWR